MAYNQIIKRFYASQVRVRFAPSPTGKLHIGGLRTAFYNYLFAKKHNGKFILRIEDTDRERLQPGSLDNIIESLKWTRIIPDCGPGFSDHSQDYVQSNRLHHYRSHIKTLLDTQVAYKCFCDSDRLELLRRNAIRNQEKVAYDGKCRYLSAEKVAENEQSGKPYVVRFKIDSVDLEYEDLVYGKGKTNLFNQEGDYVLMKSDGYPTYHFANVVDDHLMEITHVLRGQEWQSSIGKHILLYKALNWQPPQFAHLPLIYHKDGTKLSKRHGNIDVLSYRERGIFPDALISYLTTFSGGFVNATDTNADLEQFKFVGYDIDRLIPLFDLNCLITRSAKYDEQMLLHINKQFLKEKFKDSDVLHQLRGLLKQKYPEINADLLTDGYLSKILKCTRERVNTVNELLDETYAYLWSNFKFENLNITFKDAKQREQFVEFIDFLIGYIDKNWRDVDVGGNDLVVFKKDLDVHLKDYKKTLDLGINVWTLFRVLLCGNKQGPPVIDVLQAFGKDNTLYRLNNARKIFT